MIKILKHGNHDGFKKDYKFVCDKCGCEWIADNNHIALYVGGMGHIWVSCNCPECDYIGSKDVSESDVKNERR